MDEHLFHKALHMADAVVRQVKPTDMAKPTPCSEWDVRALLNHICYEVAWVGPLLQGKTIAEVGDTLDGDLLGDDPLAAWHEIMLSALNDCKLVSKDVTVHLSYGDKSASAYLDEVGADVVVHGWDLAQAIGVPYIIDADTAQAVMDGMKDTMPQARENGSVAAPIEIDPKSSAGDKLIAFYGRDINWGK